MSGSEKNRPQGGQLLNALMPHVLPQPTLEDLVRQVRAVDMAMVHREVAARQATGS